MTKILYILPALAVLGLFSAAYAETDQQRIDRFEAKIDRLEERIDRFEAKIDRLDPATDQKRIDRFEAKIDRLEERIDRFEAKIAELEAQDAGGDAEAEQGTSYTRSTYSDSPTADKPEPRTARATSTEPEVDATVTITADGRLVEDAGTVEIPYGSSMTLDVKFVNEHSTGHTLLVDLISSVFETQRDDINVSQGGSVTLTFAIPSDGPHDDDDAAKLRLVFADSEHTLRGDHSIKVVRTGEPPETDETTPSGPPSVSSITLDPDTGAMVITFSAPIDISKTNEHRLFMMSDPRNSMRLSGATFDRAASDSETLTLMLTPQQVTSFNDGMQRLNIAESSIFDLDGNFVGDNRIYPIESTGTSDRPA